MEQQSVFDDQDFSIAKGRAREVTKKHIERVAALLGDFSGHLRHRAKEHDRSKLTDVELIPLAQMQMVIDREGQAPYESDEYKRRTAMLAPMLEHHYANNSHHPEHYENGVDGMDLLDIVEMFMDWKAASERGEESAMSITAACERFEVSPQLRAIFENTANNMGFNWK